MKMIHDREEWSWARDGVEHKAWKAARVAKAASFTIFLEDYITMSLNTMHAKYNAGAIDLGMQTAHAMLSKNVQELEDIDNRLQSRFRAGPKPIRMRKAT